MNKVTKTMVISIITNIILSIIKIFFGIIGKCSALIADGIQSLSDLLTDFVTILGNHISLKPADKNHPYGYGKVEYITSLIIGTVVLVIGFSIIANSTNKEIIVPNITLIFVTLFAIIVKSILVKYILNKGFEYKNSMLIAGGKESWANVISSVVVLISIVLMQLSTYYPALEYADTIATIIVGLFTLKIGFSIIKENIKTILGEQETDLEYVDSIKEFILKNNNIKSINTLVLLKYGPYYRLMLKVDLDGNLKLKEVHSLIDKLEKSLKRKDRKLKYITVEMEPYSK